MGEEKWEKGEERIKIEVYESKERKKQGSKQKDVGSENYTTGKWTQIKGGKGKENEKE